MFIILKKTFVGILVKIKCFNMPNVLESKSLLGKNYIKIMKKIRWHVKIIADKKNKKIKYWINQRSKKNFFKVIDDKYHL